MRASLDWYDRCPSPGPPLDQFARIAPESFGLMTRSGPFVDARQRQMYRCAALWAKYQVAPHWSQHQGPDQPAQPTEKADDDFERQDQVAESVGIRGQKISSGRQDWLIGFSNVDFCLANTIERAAVGVRAGIRQ